MCIKFLVNTGPGTGVWVVRQKPIKCTNIDLFPVDFGNNFQCRWKKYYNYFYPIENRFEHVASKIETIWTGPNVLAMPGRIRADTRCALSQWWTSLQSNAVSHWLGASLKSSSIVSSPGYTVSRYTSSYVCYLFPDKSDFHRDCPSGQCYHVDIL